MKNAGCFGCLDALQSLAHLSLQLAHLLRARRDDFRPVGPVAVSDDKSIPIETKQKRRPGQLFIVEPLARAKNALVETLGERLNSRLVDIETDAVKRRQREVHPEIGNDPRQHRVAVVVN